MLYYGKINILKGIDINKSSKLKECMIGHYWYLLDENYNFEPEVCNGFHGISMVAYESKNIAISNVK